MDEDKSGKIEKEVVLTFIYQILELDPKKGETPTDGDPKKVETSTEGEPMPESET